jgi:hypothetical protein
MQDNAPKARSRAIVCGAIAVVYGALIAFAVWAMFPTERQIDADTAASALVALQQSNDKYANIAPPALRRRLYRDLSDGEVIARIREYAATEEQRVKLQGGSVLAEGAGDTRGIYVGPLSVDPAATIPGMRPQIAVTMEELDKQRAERIADLPARQKKAIIWGVVAWMIPVIALFFLVPRMFSGRRKRMRRI